MTDLSSTLNGLLSQQSCKPIGQTSYSFDRVNDFLKEAYQIHTRTTELLLYLRSIKRPYLSTAPPPRQTRLPTSSSSSSRQHHRRNSSQQQQQLHLTNTQRDSIDAEAKTTHRDISAAIQRLAQAEKVRADTENALITNKRRKRGFGALGAWAAGDAGVHDSKSPDDEDEDGRVKALRACREAMLWFLGREVEECGQVQSAMMEVRIRREVERNKGVLARLDDRKPVISSPTSLPPDSGADSSTNPQSPQQLTQEQQQLFATENTTLLKHYEDRLTQVRAAEKSILEISSLQSQLAFNLSTQSEVIDQLVNESFVTTENVTKGNEQLTQAARRKGWAQAVFRATMGACAVCVVWDLLI